MNYPQPGAYPPPGGYQPQQGGYPQPGGYPQQGGYPQITPQQVAHQAQQNTATSALTTPYQPRSSRTPKAPDGQHIGYVQEMDFKAVNNGASYILTVTFQVTDSTVPQIVGQQFEHAFFFNKAWHLEEISDFAKVCFGLETTTYWAQQYPNINMLQIAQFTAQTWHQRSQAGEHFFLLMRVQRGKPKSPGEEGFPNHYFDGCFHQNISLQQAVQQLGPQAGQQPQQPGPSHLPPPQQHQAPSQYQPPQQQAGPPPAAQPPQQYQPPQQQAGPPSAPQQYQPPQQQPAGPPPAAQPPQQPAGPPPGQQQNNLPPIPPPGS